MLFYTEFRDTYSNKIRLSTSYYKTQKLRSMLQIAYALNAHQLIHVNRKFIYRHGPLSF